MAGLSRADFSRLRPCPLGVGFTILRLHSPLEPFFTKEWRPSEIDHDAVKKPTAGGPRNRRQGQSVTRLSPWSISLWLRGPRIGETTFRYLGQISATAVAVLRDHPYLRLLRLFVPVA